MMGLLPELLQVGSISLLAVMSPGPDFAMVSRNALSFSRRAAVFSALGLGTGIIFHSSLCISGVAFLLVNFPMLYKAIKIAGALYLLWIGYQSLRAGASSMLVEGEKVERKMGAGEAFRLGFFTNALNPKATLFVFSLFTQIVGPETSIGVQALMGTELAGITFAWFSFIAIFLTQSWVRSFLSGVERYINRVLGVVLISCGVYLMV